MTDAIRILLIDDQTTIRQALQMLLEREPGFEIIGGAADGQSGVEAIERLKPDVVLVDIEMPGIDGIEAARIINQRYPAIKVLMLTGQDDQSYLQRALQAGAKGYLLKTTPAEDLIYAIRAVKKGYSQVSPGLIEKMMQGASQTVPAVVPDSTQPSQAHSASLHEEQLTRARALLRCMMTLQRMDARTRLLQARLEMTLSRGNSLKSRFQTL